MHKQLLYLDVTGNERGVLFVSQGHFHMMTTVVPPRSMYIREFCNKEVHIRVKLSVKSSI